MAELIVVAFDQPDTADRVLSELGTLGKEKLIELEDACVVVRPPEGEVQLKQALPLTKVGALSGASSGALWGALVGLLFLNPLAGMVVGAGVGAGTGALAGQLSDYGIDDDFIRSLGSTIKPNSSALFQSWLGLFGQVFRLDRWSVCRVQAAAICGRRVK